MSAFSFGKHFGYWLLGVLVLLAVVLVVLRVGELEHFVELAKKTQPFWLLLACILQALTYICAAAVWHMTLARLSYPCSLHSLVPLGLAKLFTDQALPSGGISGTLLVIQGLVRRGVPSSLAMSAMLVGLVSFYTAYGIAAFLALGFLHFYHRVWPGLTIIAAIFAVLVVIIPIVVLSLRWFKDHPWLHQILKRIPEATFLIETMSEAPLYVLKDPALMCKTILLQLAIFLLDAATFDVMLCALGQKASPISAFVSFMVADIVAMVGPIPLGLGTFEGTAVWVLHATGIPIEAALAATLLLRGFTFWLPMLPGLFLARRELQGDKAQG